MKRIRTIIGLLIFSCLLLGSIGHQGQVQAATYKTGTYQTRKKLYVYKKASTKATKLTSIKKGVKVTVSSLANKKYGKVTYKGKTGYIYLPYTSYVYVSGNYKANKKTYVYAKKSTKGKKLVTIVKGTTLQVTSVSGRYGKVTYKRKTGYVYLPAMVYQGKAAASTTSSQEGSDETSHHKVVYMTFDDGPSANTEKVLDILKKNQVKATFFVCGDKRQNYYQFIKRAAREGHAIGAHCFKHDYENYVSEEAYYEDLEKIQNVIVAQTGKRTNFLRFPGGSSNTVSRKRCLGIMSKLVVSVQEHGYQYYDWNVSSDDATERNPAVEKIITAATNTSKETVVLLMHDAAAKTHTVEALPDIIAWYRDHGYTFKPLNKNSTVCHDIVAN